MTCDTIWCKIYIILTTNKRLSDALRLLPNPLPENIAVYELATSLFFRTDNYKKCIEVSRKLALMKTPLTQKEQFMYAESLCRQGVFEEAEQAFMVITEESDFYLQCLYRLAQIARQKKNEKKALSLFKKIVETERKSLWKQYAERELQFAKAAARM